MIPGDVSHHHFLEAERAIVRQTIDNARGTSHQQFRGAGAAVAFGEDAIHFGVCGGIRLRNEDVTTQYGPRRSPGFHRGIAIHVELTNELRIARVLTRKPTVAERTGTFDRGRYRTCN